MSVFYQSKRKHFVAAYLQRPPIGCSCVNRPPVENKSKQNGLRLDFANSLWQYLYWIGALLLRISLFVFSRRSWRCNYYLSDLIIGQEVRSKWRILGDELVIVYKEVIDWQLW